MAGKFEVYEDKAGRYRFNLKAGNGEIIAVSSGYETKAAAHKGIESVRQNTIEPEIDDQTLTPSPVSDGEPGVVAEDSEVADRA